MLNKDAIQELSKSQAITAAGSEIEIGMATRNATVALPSDFNVHDLEKYLPIRRRSRGSMTTSVIASFASYASKYKETGSAIFIDPKSMSATAVLNIGTPEKPGHCDNTAIVIAERTAACTALQDIIRDSKGQKEIAEFLEDWSHLIECTKDGDRIPNNKAIAAIRSINIEELRKIGNEVQNLSVSRSAFEKIEAKSEHTIPSEIRFNCVPYKDLSPRTFAMRLGILTGGEKPVIVLRIIKAEEHVEQMAGELAQLITDAIKDDMPVLIGKYVAK